MTDEKLEAMIKKLDTLVMFDSGVQLRHYRAAVAYYEGKMRKKYGRSDYWRVMLVEEDEILKSLRKALLLKKNYIYGFYGLVDRVSRAQDKLFADALIEMGIEL